LFITSRIIGVFEGIIEKPVALAALVLTLRKFGRDPVIGSSVMITA